MVWYPKVPSHRFSSRLGDLICRDFAFFVLLAIYHKTIDAIS